MEIDISPLFRPWREQFRVSKMAADDLGNAQTATLYTDVAGRRMAPPVWRRHEEVGLMSEELSFEDECYAMANLSPRMTGLSRHVFVSPRMASHDVRVKVSATPGKNTLPVGGAIIGLRPRVHHVAGPVLPADVMDELERWVGLNFAALVDYWDGNIDTGELLAALKRI